MTGQVILAFITGLGLWVMKSTISHTIKRSRFRAALLVDITSHLAGAREQEKASKVLVTDTLQVGQKVPFPISYFVDGYSFYGSVQSALPSYLNKTELVKVIKFYQALWQLDVAVNGLATTVSLWERDGIALSQANIDHLKNRLARIVSFCDCLTDNKVEVIGDLPDDYRQVKDADSVVRKT